MRITVEEARANFDKLIEAVRNGEQVTIVEDDRAVAEMRRPSDAARRLRELGKGVTLGVSARQILDEGRKT